METPKVIYQDDDVLVLDKPSGWVVNDETFLKKISGTYVKDNKGKKHTVCFECQKKLKTKEDLLKAIG